MKDENATWAGYDVNIEKRNEKEVRGELTVTPTRLQVTLSEEWRAEGEVCMNPGQQRRAYTAFRAVNMSFIFHSLLFRGNGPNEQVQIIRKLQMDGCTQWVTQMEFSSVEDIKTISFTTTVFDAGTGKTVMWTNMDYFSLET
jgi:hypothetical protein